MPVKVKRFRLKPGVDILSIPFTTLSPLTYVHKDSVKGVWRELTEDITINIAFPEDLSKWNDFDYILVLDENFGQPYTPFYNHMNDEVDENTYLGKVITAYNKYMESIESLGYLEEI